MSFSSDLKKELAAKISPARHCQLAETAAIISCVCLMSYEAGEEPLLLVNTGEGAAVRKLFTLLKKAFNIDVSVFLPEKGERASGSRVYEPVPMEPADVIQVLTALRMLDGNGELHPAQDGISQVITKNSCCKRAFLRDVFLCGGSMTDPGKSYHLEFSCDEEGFAAMLKGLLAGLGLGAGETRRQNSYVVYIKDSAQIADLLRMMDAPVALMRMENERILREVRGNVNRRVNCEAANINKTVGASARQIESIRYLEENGYLERLPESLRVPH